MSRRFQNGPNTPIRKSGKTKYPWDEKWFDGGCWMLTKGIDFRCTVHAFRTAVALAALARGAAVEFRQRDRFVYIQCFGTHKEGKLIKRVAST